VQLEELVIADAGCANQFFTSHFSAFATPHQPQLEIAAHLIEVELTPDQTPSRRRLDLKLGNRIETLLHETLRQRCKRQRNHFSRLLLKQFNRRLLLDTLVVLACLQHYQQVRELIALRRICKRMIGISFIALLPEAFKNPENHLGFNARHTECLHEGPELLLDHVVAVVLHLEILLENRLMNFIFAP
jgi:hypothetical protein